jgi:hypothetical protein
MLLWHLRTSVRDGPCLSNNKPGCVLRLQAIAGWRVKSVVPFNPVDKKTTAEVVSPDGQDLIVTKGAPQVQLLSSLGFRVYGIRPVVQQANSAVLHSI